MIIIAFIFRTKRSDSSESTDINQSDTYTTLGPAAQPESHTYSSLQPPHASYSSPSEEGSANAEATYETLQHTEDYYNMGNYATCAFHSPSDDTQDYENSNIFVNNK
mgnify:CR=1 FL=1